MDIISILLTIIVYAIIFTIVYVVVMEILKVLEAPAFSFKIVKICFLLLALVLALSVIGGALPLVNYHRHYIEG